ncbi:MAG: hypothetical protein ACFFF4_18905 [Candidatus Thorarchaeota archaeon]
MENVLSFKTTIVAINRFNLRLKKMRHPKGNDELDYQHNLELTKETHRKLEEYKTSARGFIRASLMIK